LADFTAFVERQTSFRPVEDDLVKLSLWRDVYFEMLIGPRLVKKFLLLAEHMLFFGRVHKR
jgi:hypothetical protein